MYLVPAVNVFPNPAVDFIWVENFTPGAQVTIFDVNGKLALMSNQSENKIDISSLNPGCYFIVITSSGGIHYSKFIKTNF
ncbi:MAG: T9SS type A sorting domain-containing protein [Chitinophagaceae bacterium]